MVHPETTPGTGTKGAGAEEGKQAGIPLPPADTGDVSCGLRLNTQLGFTDEALRNYQAFIRCGGQLLKCSWKLQAPPLGIPDHTTGTADYVEVT